MKATILTGDCRDVLATLAENSVDSIVTDPPYELDFMGKAWDRSGVAYDVRTWREALRVAKPGAFLLAFGGTRTHHRVACAIEDAGWEIRDTIMWIYGSGFPKSHNGAWGGTALKPAHEPIIVARKPLIGTVAANFAVHGTAGLNIDACRVGTSDDTARVSNGAIRGGNYGGGDSAPGPIAGGHAAGRWPANVIHDGSDAVLSAFPEAPGQMAEASTDTGARKTLNTYGAMRRGRADEPSATSANTGAVGFRMKPGARRLDSGSAARFFYCAKASRTDRNAGLFSGCVPVLSANATMRDRQEADWEARNGNFHPTVKPTELMRYLVRLVTPAGGVCADIFMGSGSTGRGAVLEGFRFLGIEMCDGSLPGLPNYAAIAIARIADAENYHNEASSQADLFTDQAA